MRIASSTLHCLHSYYYMFIITCMSYYYTCFIQQAVSVHCFRGIGRTGTMIACYFVKYEGMTAENAIQKIRQLRPGSIETKDQEDLVTDFYQQMKSIEAERR